MLRKITLCQTSCYGETPQIVAPLRKINIIYGENGAGKSTIARMIKDNTHPDFSDSHLEWENNIPIKCLIYNKQFIEDTLKDTEIPGVFTLGKEAVDITTQITGLKEQRGSLTAKLSNTSKTLQDKNQELAKANKEFINQCWEIKKKYEAVFYPAFLGLNNNKVNFHARCIESIPVSQQHSYEDLANEYRNLFTTDKPKVQIIPLLNTNDIPTIENHYIFSQNIVGKNDIDISKLINSLGNSDWVRQGIKYLPNSQCPFCQQRIPTNLRQQLEEYFDETYNRQISELEKQHQNYNESVESIIEQAENIYKLKYELLKLHDIPTAINSIRSKSRKNNSTIESKLKEPSKIIKLESISTDIDTINSTISVINSYINDYNLKLDNIQQEKEALISKTWSFIGNEIKPFHQSFTKRATPLTKAINSLFEKIKSHTTALTEIHKKMSLLESEISSIVPSKEGINRTLKLYGFDNFELENNENSTYKIKRSDGTYANETLSEGEKTFITFLYFYQIIQGSITKSDIESPRVIVFDDPVSSLDSKVLFIVSALIRNLFSNKEMTRLNIEQIFILTHNVYFHKEVSFLKNIKHLGPDPLTQNDFSFFTIRKIRGTSTTTHHERNPIKTNYHLLWQEIQVCAKEGICTISTCNIMRRILENYFQILGGDDLFDMPNKFEGIEKIAVRSLTSWINDGSHFAHENIDLDAGSDLSDHYLPVFRKIFDKTGHIKHYDMMMAHR